MLPSTFDYIVQAVGQHISHTSKFSENMFGRNTVCDPEVSLTCCTFNTHNVLFCDRASLIHWMSASSLMNHMHW